MDTQETLFAFMEQYYNELFRYGIKFTGDIEEAKDTVNQFFIHFWAISLFDNDAFEPSEKSYEDFLVRQIMDKEVAQIFREAIELLPKRQKELLKLRFYDHLDFEEISILTSLNIRTVYNKIHEAIKQLRSNQSILEMRRKGQ